MFWTIVGALLFVFFVLPIIGGVGVVLVQSRAGRWVLAVGGLVAVFLWVAT